MKAKNIFIIIILMYSTVISRTGAHFLDIGMGARAMGMSGAYTGVSDDVDAIYWNPGGLTNLKRGEATLMLSQWFEGISYGYIGYAMPLRGIGVIGASVIYLTTGSIEEVDKYGNKTGNSFGGEDISIGLTYSKLMGYGVSIGITGKYIKESIGSEIASGIGFDFGVYWRGFKERVGIGISIQNVGSKLKFVREEYTLPMNIRVGLSYRILGNMIIASDVGFQGEEGINIKIGMEYEVIKAIRIRGGWRTNGGLINSLGGRASGLSILEGITGGIGFKVDELVIDYAFVPYGDLGNTHRVSLSVRL